MSGFTCVAIIVSVCVLGGVALVIAGHPWFALLVFLIAGSVSYSEESKKP